MNRSPASHLEVEDSSYGSRQVLGTVNFHPSHSPESNKMHIRRKPVGEAAIPATEKQIPIQLSQDLHPRSRGLPKPAIEPPAYSVIPDELHQRMGGLYVNQVPPTLELLPSPLSPINSKSIVSEKPVFQEPVPLEHNETPPSPDFDNTESLGDSFFSDTTLTPSGDDLFDEHFLEMTDSNSIRRIPRASTGSRGSTLSTTASQKSNWSVRSDKVKAKMSYGLEETSIFLGGLIRKPIESRRHYTILRHSYGLVYYKGPETAVAITIFSDRPLPCDRRLWFQMKGWTGNAGMATKAFLRQNSSWINVTPDRQVQAKDFPTLDERAWQRDILKFQKRAPKSIRSHIVRETAVIRIPAECTDGYFRVVLTEADSKGVLCPSPVFRIASTSMSASSLKGASLKTLPLELAVKVAQVTAKTMATTAAAPYAATAQAKVVTAIPATQYAQYAEHAKGVYGMIGVQEKVDSALDRAETRQSDNNEKIRQEGQHGTYDLMSRPPIVGDNCGPALPFPLRLKGKVSVGSGRGREEFGVPTANLDDLAPDRMAQLNYGTYFGYAKVLLNKTNQMNLEPQWEYAIISIIRDPRKDSSVAQRKVLRVYLIHSYPPEFSFLDSTLDVLFLGWLRPLLSQKDQQIVVNETIQDINIVGASLEREAWCIERTLQRVKTQDDSQTLFDRVVNVKTAGQRQLDRIPIHKVGVRNGSLASHDRGLYGNGGVFIKRD